MNTSERLPLLEYIDQEFEHLDLSNCLLFASQNLLGSTETVIEHLLSKGLDRNHISIIGKSYSTSDQVITNLQKKNIYVSPYSTAFDPNIAFDQQYEHYVKDFLSIRSQQFDLQKFHKIILLDEGCKLLENAEQFLPKNKLIGVEQSSRRSLLQTLNIDFPCITIARSKAKLFIESPMIADAVINKLMDFIKSSNLSAYNFLIIGNGFIGQAIAKTLKNLSDNVKIFDHNIDKSELTPEDCDSYLPNAQVIIGCVYGSALKRHQYDLLSDKTILASASLSDRAFQAAEFRKQIKIENCHQDLAVYYHNKKLYLLNCGFPINFSGKLHSVPPKKIQITRGLLLGAIYESLTEKFNSINEISHILEKKIIKKFLDLESELELQEFLHYESNIN